jgi:hypothetical protein
MAAASAILMVFIEIDAFAVALDHGIGADALPALAGAVLRAFVTAFATVVVARGELDTRFVAIARRAADLTVLRLAAIVSTHMWAAAVAVSVFLEAVRTDAPV